MKKRMSLMLMLSAILLFVCRESGGFHRAELPGKNPFRNYSNATVLEWNAVAQETMQGPSYNPLLATRILAMMHIAMHDALNGIAPVYETYLLKKQEKKADPVAAISAAAHTV